jgi:hypothetical protein
MRRMAGWIAAIHAYKKLAYLSYRPSGEEAGPEKTFDLSRATIAGRWTAGGDDMRGALLQPPENGPVSALTVVRRAGF